MQPTRNTSTTPRAAVGASLPSTPGLIVLAVAVSVTLGFAFKVWMSDIDAVAVVMLDDDAYYYLQPAWLFWEHGFFTFDGLDPMYGFQPLWTLLLTAVAGLASDKLEFVRLTAALGAALYCTTGVLIYRLSRHWFDPWPASVAALLWLLNLSLMHMYTTGMENALSASVLVMALTALLNAWRRESTRSLLWLGIAAGLLTLARVNTLPLALAFMGFVFVFPPRQREGPRALTARVGLVALGFAVTAGAWGLYAQAAFGTAFPTSGSVKLIPQKAALVQFLAGVLPGLPLESLLSPYDRLLLQRPEALDVPTFSRLIRYLLELPPTVLAFWVGPGKLGGYSFVIWPLRAVLLIWGVAAGAAAFRALRRVGVRGALFARWHPHALALFVITGWAAVNTLTNWLLLSKYLTYATWYQVPETVAGSLWLGALVVYGARAMSEFSEGDQRLPAAAGALLVLLLVAPLGVRAALQFTPERYPVERSARHFEWQAEILDAHDWVIRHVPAGSRLAAWNSGLLGYLAFDYTVINLDGLANSPEYARDVMRPSILFKEKLGDQNAIWEYLQAKRVEYLVDVWYEEQIGKEPFYGILPEGRYEILHTGEPFRDGLRMFVVQLR